MLLALLAVVSTGLVWLPFLAGFGGGIFSLFANYDGPNYLVIVKTWYDPQLIRTQFSLPLPVEYYPAHWPGYPLTVALVDAAVSGPWASLLATLAASVAAVSVFYLFIARLKLTAQPFWLAVVFLFLPARYLAVRSIGSPEPLFTAALLASLYFFIKKRWWLAGLFGALAQLTKSPGILLFIAYTLLLGWEAVKTKKIPWKAYPLALIPLTVLAVFGFYYLQTGNPLAYFQSGDNFHLVFPPFQAFNSARTWLGDFWLEDMVYVYLLGALSFFLLVKQKRIELAAFVGVFYTATLFVAHRDLARYSLPLAPFYLIAFAPFLEKREFKLAFVVILGAIYMYAFNFLANNTAPVADWTPYL